MKYPDFPICHGYDLEKKARLFSEQQMLEFVDADRKNRRLEIAAHVMPSIVASYDPEQVSRAHHEIASEALRLADILMEKSRE